MAEADSGRSTVLDRAATISVSLWDFAFRLTRATPARSVLSPLSSGSTAATLEAVEGSGTRLPPGGVIESIESAALSSSDCLGPGDDGAVECSGEEAVESVVAEAERGERGGETSAAIQFRRKSNCRGALAWCVDCRRLRRRGRMRCGR